MLQCRSRRVAWANLFARAHPIADTGKLLLAHATHQIMCVGALVHRQHTKAAFGRNQIAEEGTEGHRDVGTQGREDVDLSSRREFLRSSLRPFLRNFIVCQEATPKNMRAKRKQVSK